MKIANIKGFTIFENLGAILLFMVGIAGIMPVFIQSMDVSLKTDRAYTAYNLAKNRIENLKSFSFADLSLAAETNTLLDQDGVPDLDGNFERSTAVTASYNSDPNLTQVTVTVNYKYRGAWATNPIQMASVIYNGS